MEIKCIFIALIFTSSCTSICFSNQEGFLSLSCGATSDFFDSSSIAWVSDAPYVNSGNVSWPLTARGSREDASTFPIRFFPDSQSRKCYNLPVKNWSSALVLVRAQFVYKNYDELGQPPAFSFSIGTAIAGSVDLRVKDPWTEEIIWPVNAEAIVFCLHSFENRRSPVISSLELRPLPRDAYQGAQKWLQSKSLRKAYRINCGSTQESLRYPLDRYDRIWDTDEQYDPPRASSEFNVRLRLNDSDVGEGVPASVLQTARVVSRKSTLSYNLSLETLADYYIILYFAGILPVSPNFDVLVNGNAVQSNYTVERYGASAIRITEKGIKNLNVTLNSNFSFLQINAIEVYEILNIPDEVSPAVVSALRAIQQSARIMDAVWEDDPCSPIQWDRVGCEGSTITSLKLSGINLNSAIPKFDDLLDLKILDLHNTSAGRIQNVGNLRNLETLNLSFNRLSSFENELSNLVNLQVLDLQNNNLQGTVPEWLGNLKNLRVLNLQNNHLEGTLPRTLRRKHLDVRTLGNRCLSFLSISCNDSSSNAAVKHPPVANVKHRKLTLVVGGCVAGSSIIAMLLFIAIVLRKRKVNIAEVCKSIERSDTTLESTKLCQARMLSLREIKAATNNFKEIIGRGSLGYVYLGKLPKGNFVVVKVRFQNSPEDAETFIKEVSSISGLEHPNIVRLEGFCYEQKQQILVYPYQQGGSLADHLYGSMRKTAPLNWRCRVKIAVDAAKGLNYMHNGLESRVIHGDVKSSNILLDRDLNAKIDTALSKRVAASSSRGTSIYIDPEYYTTQELTDKSDVYSLGVVLLEMICGRKAVCRKGTPETFNLVLWAKPYLQAAQYDVVDPSLQGHCDMISLTKVASAAVWAVDRDPSRRPAMAHLLADLNLAYLT